MLWQPTAQSQVNLIGNYQELDDYYGWRLYDGLVPGTGGSNPFEAIYTKFSDREDYGDRPSGATTDVKDVALKYEWSGDLTNIDVILSFQDFDTTLFQNHFQGNALASNDLGVFIER